MVQWREEAGPMKAEDYINKKALSERLDGDFDLFKELAQLFLSDSPKLISAIEDAINNKNSEKIGKSSHTIKGAVANFSAEKAFTAALELEKIGKNHELDKVDDAYKKLLEEIENMRKALQVMMDENRL
jgi:two-component system, sensor histidine kinase and response regulator